MLLKQDDFIFDLQRFDVIKLTQADFDSFTNGVTRTSFVFHTPNNSSTLCYGLTAGEYELDADINLTRGPIFINSDVTINLGNHTLTANTSATYYNAICVQDSGNLTINAESDGKIVSSNLNNVLQNENYALIKIEGAGSLTMNGGTIEAGSLAVCASSTGRIDISNANIKSNKWRTFICKGSGATINISKSTLTSDASNVIKMSSGSAGTTLTVSDSTLNCNSTSSASAIDINWVAAAVNVSNSTVNSSNSGYCIDNSQGTLTVENSTVDNTGGPAITTNSNSITNINNSTVKCKSDKVALVNQGTLTVSGDQTSILGGSNAISNSSSGSVTVNDGTLTSGTASAISNSGSGSVTINGGTITADGNGDEVFGIRNSSSKSVKITGGSISGIQHGIVNSGSGTIDVSGGTVSGNNGILNWNGAGVVNVSGTASIKGNTARGIWNYNANNTLSVSGGTIEGKTYGVQVKDGTVSISDGTIKGNTYSVYNESTGTGSLSGGTYNGQIATNNTTGIGYSITGAPNFKSNPLLGANSTLLKYASGTAGVSLIGADGWNGTSTQGQYFYLNTTDNVYGNSVVSLAGVNNYENVGIDTANSVFAVPNSAMLSSFATTGSQYQLLQYSAKKTTASELKSDAEIVIDSDKLFGTSITKIDGSENAQAMSILGGNGVTEITGGTGADSLIAGSNGVKLDGGTGANTLTGGAGADTFIYNGGANLIKNYGTDDIVNLNDIEAVTSGASISSNDNGFTIGFGKGNSLTFAGNDIKAKVKSGGQTYTYSKDAIALNKSVTLTEGATAYSLDSDNTYNAVSAADVKGAVSLIGNAFANTLTAGDHNSSLDGKDGNDNLYGGTGADVFIYSDSNKSGKDAIYGYGAADSLKVTTNKIISGTANSNTGDLVFKIDNSNSITFKPADDGTSVEKILLAGSTDSLTKDGVIDSGDSILTLFKEQKGRVDLNDSIYSGVAGIDASKITDGGVTMTGGSLGGAFTFANNKKKTDVFEYNGGAVSLRGYTAGVDKIDLGAASLQSFTFGEGSAVSLTTDKGVISLDGAQGKEVLLHDATGKNNSFSKMVFAASGVLYDKEKNPTAAILSYGAGGASNIYEAANSIKKITVGNGVAGISVQASSKNTIIDASNAGDSVTLIGGKGNDKFTGKTKGADIFVFTAGKDVITNYESGDFITATGFDPLDAKITQNKKSVTLKFDNKNTLAIKSDESIGAININGTDYEFGKNAVITTDAETNIKTAKLTSNFSGTYKAGDNVTVIDGSAISKKHFTMQGTTANETLIGGSSDKKKVTFKGGGGNDSLVGGNSKDTFFYAKNDKGAKTVDYFDYANDNLKIKRAISENGIKKISSGLEFQMSSGNSLTLKTDNKNTNIGSSNVLIKANNTLYWFETGSEGYGLYTANDKESKTQIKSVLRSKDSYAIVELGYSTNLVKGKIANVTETVFNAAMAENYKIK